MLETARFAFSLPRGEPTTRLTITHPTNLAILLHLADYQGCASSSTKKAATMSGNQSQQPGLVQGHVQYVKGVAEVPHPAPRSTTCLQPGAHRPSLTRRRQGTVGDLTGSQPWKESGEQDKAAGLSAMREAGEKRDPSAQGYGKAEELAGKLTGCDGMKSEGAASRKKD